MGDAVSDCVFEVTGGMVDSRVPGYVGTAVGGMLVVDERGRLWMLCWFGVLGLRMWMVCPCGLLGTRSGDQDLNSDRWS